MIEIKKELLKTARNSIRLEIGGAVTGSTKFGGMPDVPEGFEWAYYNGRPLSFLAQFDLEEISRYDTENLLPRTGVLSFFYDLETKPHSVDDEDRGFAKVYWFEDKNALLNAEFPDDLKTEYRLPALGITARSEKSYQSYPDFLLQRAKLVEDWESFERAQNSIGIDESGNISKMLGWADPIRGNMTVDCELISRGYFLGDEQGQSNALSIALGEVTPLDKQEAEQWSAKDWLPLLQLDTVTEGEFCLKFGDPGRLYFYIRRDDLAARDFNEIMVFVQN